MKFLSPYRFFAIVILSCIFLFGEAQPVNDATKTSFNKPYRILTAGKQITVKSTQDIKSVMVWTSSGHRIIEQKEINAPSYSFRISVNEKIFFVMLELEGERRFTEKIGVQ
ncbi:MAG: hypothetical protein WDN26_18690 [Chitinophagaceae bacterium]